MRRRRGPTAAASMPHGKIYNPAKFCEVTGARRAPRHGPDHILASALECARHKTGLGYRLWGEFIRDFPGVRGSYGGEELGQYDARRRQIYDLLKHRDGRYMAAFASYMSDACETAIRAYHKRRAHDPNARRPRCTNPVLRQGAGSCVIYGRGFWCKLSDAPNQPLLESPYVRLRFPVTPSRHTMEVQLTPHVVEKIATAVRVGAVTLTDTTISIAYEPQPVAPAQPKGMAGMDVNKREHVAADTDGNVRRMPNAALVFARARRKKLAALGVTGGKTKRGRRHATPRHVRHPGKKPRNKGGRTKKRRDERVSRRERSRINARFGHQKDDWLYKLMHEIAALGFALVLEEKTINRLLVRSNRNMSKEERDLLKMGLSQGRVRAVADSVFPKYGLSVYGVTPAGTSSMCPACGEKLWAARYGTKSWGSWRRTKACVPCLYYVDRDSVAAINIVWRGVSAYEPAAGPEPHHADGSGRQVAGDWEQRAPQLVQMLLGAAVVWFPYTGEGRRPKGGAKNPPYDMAGDARPPDDRPDASNGLTGLGPPGETPGPYVSGTHLGGFSGIIHLCDGK